MKRLDYLFNQYQANQLSEQEELEWLEVLTDPAQKQAIDELAQGIFRREDLLKFQIDDSKAKDILDAILSHPQLNDQKTFVLWKRIAVAAAILFVVGAGLVIYLAGQRTNNPDYVNDIIAGKKGAILTLSNGKKIRLSDGVKEVVANEAGIKVTKTKNGQLVYEVVSNVVPSLNDGADPSLKALKESFNTLTTSNGETYQIRLPDGSLIYLNAASSLTYSASLMENGKRSVKLSGEGYFEIAKDKAHPFVVKTNNQEVEVLGTHFNVNSYGDDGIEKTTLLEGSVKMTADGMSKILKPGQQGKLGGNKLSLSEIDTDLAIAWKNNEFTFESESIETVMKMVERWYNVAIVYVGDKTNEKFSGRVSRFDNVSKVLKIVESTGYVHFKIEGRKIYVSKP